MRCFQFFTIDVFTARQFGGNPLAVFPAEGLRDHEIQSLEDAATGGAATPLAALLRSLTDNSEGNFDVLQGVEVGRPGRLLGRSRRTASGIRACVGGSRVKMLKGEISLPSPEAEPGNPG